MSKNYTQTTASLKTVSHDTFILDSQKVMFYPGNGEPKDTRVDLATTINNTNENISSISSDLDGHTSNDIIHIDETMRSGIETLIANESDYVKKSQDVSLGKNLTVTGTATFNSSLTKSNNTSSPSNTSILNKGENDNLYAPKSLSTTVGTLNTTVGTINTNLTNLTSTVNGLNTVYASKSAYDSFVTSTNNSISTINTTLSNCAKTNATNTFTGANTFNSTANIKGAATFDSTITKSNKTSSPSDASVLNKGENDILYAPSSISGTVTSIQSNITTIEGDISSIQTDITTIESDIESIDTDLSTVSTVVADHVNDMTVHLTLSDKNDFNNLILEKDSYVKKTDDVVFEKSVKVNGDVTFESNITKSNNSSSPTSSSILNKGESDALYAPKSLSTTVTNLSNTVDGLGSTYVAKTTYDSFVTSTNNSISTLNTNVGKCALKTDLNSYVKSTDLTTTLGNYVTSSGLTTTLGSYAKTSDLGAYAKTGSANTFTAANTFNSTATIKGAATFNSTITKSTNTSNPTGTSVLNKGENDALYAPKSITDTVSDLETGMATVTTIITSHEDDTSIHIAQTEREGLTSLISEKDNFAKKSECDELYAPKSLSTTVTNLGNTVNGLGSTYVAKTTYDSFVTSTNNSISTLNTNVGKCALKTDLNSYVTTTSLNTTLGSYATTASLSAYAKVGSANTFTAANTFNSTTITKGAATFNSTITKTATTSSPADTAVLNKGENDALYAPKSHVSDTSVHMSAADRETLAEVIEIAEELTTTAADFAKKTEANTFTETNTFSKAVTAQNGITASGGDIVISNGTLTFEDLIDGTVVERSGASGYQYVEGMPTSFENGVCYDIGEISNTTDLSNVKFTAEGRLVQTCELWFKTPATVPTTHKWPTNIYWIDSATGAAPTLIASKNYRLVFRQEPNKIIASIAYLY